MRPEFIDNRGGNTLLKALNDHLAWLEENRSQAIELSVATGYFNAEGFSLLTDRLREVERIRLLIGAEPIRARKRPLPKPGQARGERYQAQEVERALKDLSEGLKRDRDLLGFTPEVESSFHKLLEFLEDGKVEVRRFEREFLHGKAFLFNSEEGVIAGSSNFTAAGLTTNLELNLGRYDPTPVRKVRGWFDDLWEEAVPFDLAEVYRARFRPYDPYLIYLRVLYELYGQEVEEERLDEGPIRLTTFQSDGIDRARRILSRYHGVVIADGVGLGKTFIGGELIREAVQERRQRALLIAPAALRDGTWARFVHRHQLYMEKVSYEELAMDQQLGGEYQKLQHEPDQYALVVIDEAQAFRNPSTERARALRRLLQGSPPKDLVLLSATPVNNSLWDLYYLLNYFVPHDAVFSHRGIPSMRDRFKQAVDEDPYELRPDVLFDILDETTVRRTRHFVKRYYPNEEIPGPDGEKTIIRFPDPHVEKVTYDLDTVFPDFFDEFKEALAPEEGDPELTLARYWPSLYQWDGVPQHNEVALVGLLRSGLLKRFESSAHAFSRTAGRMADSHDAFLAVLEQGFIAAPKAIQEWQETDSDEAFEDLLVTTGSESAEGYDVERLKRDVINDRDLLRRFSEVAGSLTREKDPKLATLLEEVVTILEAAERDGITPSDVRDKRKVLIFSYFADTVEWIEEFLLEAAEKDPRMKSYQGRIASVTSEDSRRGISREQAIFGFAPKSTEAPGGADQDEFDILVTTDVLAEGQNLQQCRNIINYDLPWNPMRLVQRNGRIDRIGSPHSEIFIRCVFPDERLNDLLDLENRVRQKLAQAAASVGVESEVIPEGATSEIVFAETREQIEALRREEGEFFEMAGEEPNAYSGEEYRQELRAGLKSRGEEIRSLPWAAGSGFAGGLRGGHFFCARLGNDVYLRFVPKNPQEELVKDTLGCLRLINCHPETDRHMSEDARERAYDAWRRARKDIYEDWTRLTDPANLQPRVRPLFREMANHLREYPPKDLEQNALYEILDSLEAPYGLRIERQFRDVFEQEGVVPVELSRQIVELSNDLGLQPYVAPEPRPPIEEEEVQLICWMTVVEGRTA